MGFDIRKILENSEIVLAIADTARQKIADKINKDLEDELIKSQVRMHAVEEKLRISEDELRDTVKDLGEAARKLQESEIEVKRLRKRLELENK